MPAGLRLELMTDMRSDLANTEQEFTDDMNHKVYGIGLGVLFIG